MATSPTPRETVLVTGGSGFIAAHCILQLLQSNYAVRTTIRSLQREPQVRATLSAAAQTTPTNLTNLTFHAADLLHDAGWPAAVQGCTYVLHIASPFPLGTPKHEDDLIIPARDGCLRVLRAARDVGVKRVVLTSALAAILNGQPESQHGATPPVYTEEHWAVLDAPGTSAYTKSKTLAEKAAWEFIREEGGVGRGSGTGPLELAVVNPGAVFGPVLPGGDSSPSIQIVARLLDGSLPACPRLTFPTVDVRDVADLHLRAMVDPGASGERFVCSSPPGLSMKGMSLALRERLGVEKAGKCPRHEMPEFLVRVAAVFDGGIRLVVGELGKVREVSVEKARERLGWVPRSGIDAVVATAESLIELELVKN